MKLIKQLHIQILLLVVLALFTYTTIHNAWLCDDAFITFRTIDNFVHGFGLTWNISERVQTYTHPLWMLLLALLNFFTGEIYYTSLFFSIALSLAALLWVILNATNLSASVLGASILLLSKAYMDYTSSGLENPLSHFLLGGFIYFFLKRKQWHFSLFWLSFTAALGCLTRSDLLLLFAPFLLWLLYENRKWRNLSWILAGFTPFFAWELFSLFYYGIPVPNTAYAKLISLDIPRWQLLIQGGYYYLNSIQTDPITLFAILSATIVSFFYKKDITIRLLTMGILLYLVYIASIGGGFMSGRFFTVPLYASVLIFIRFPIQIQKPKWAIILSAIWIFGLFSPDPPLLSGSLYGTNPNNLSDEHFIYNERAHYFQKTGLFAISQWDFSPDTVDRTPPPLFDEYIPIQPEVRVGIKGYKYGPYIHVVDCLALADPLLSRLPCLRPWKIAHFYRHLPAGYLESLQHDNNQLEDPKLRQYYKVIRLITRGKLWDSQRLIKIVKLNFGFYSHLINEEYYKQPPRKIVHFSELNNNPDPYRNWYDQRNLHFPNTGLEIHLNDSTNTKQIELSLDKFSDYKVLFYHDDKLLGETTIERPHAQSDVTIINVSAPPHASEMGFNRIIIEPVQANSRCTLGHFQIVQM